MMLGLRRGTVELHAHDKNWSAEAEKTIALLRQLLGDAAVAIEHVGSTAVPGLAAKPIIDIVVGVRDLCVLNPYVEKLAQRGICEAGQDLPEQRLFVMGDFVQDTRTHHIHVVIWNASAWNNYIRFREYLKTFREKAEEYETVKEALAARYPHDRNAYTQGKAATVEKLLQEANRWQTAVPEAGGFRLSLM